MAELMAPTGRRHASDQWLSHKSSFFWPSLQKTSISANLPWCCPASMSSPGIVKIKCITLKYFTTMATNANTNNSFNLSGFVAVNAKVRSFDKSAVARFPLSISRTETVGEEQVRKSALINCECWRKTGDTSVFDLLQKGKRVQLSGFIRPDEWTAEDGTKHNGIIFVVTSAEEAAKAEEALPEAKVQKKGKATKKKEAA